MIPLYFDSFPDALDALSEKLRARRFEPDVYYIVLTPDRYTLQVETALFKGSGALDCEVLTLSRLCRRVLGSGKLLSREGGVMLTARAIAAVSGELSYYSHAVRYGEFAREVYETLAQIDASDADVGRLTAGGATGEKLHDLALIKAEYDRLKADCSDSADRLRELIGAAKDSPLIKGAHIFAIGYKNATKLNHGVFDALSAAARSFTLYDAAPPVPRDRLALCRAPDRVAQYKAVAARIREYVYKGRDAGARYGDVSVICREPRALSRILREYGVNFYADSDTALFDTPPLSALHCIYRISRGDGSTAAELAKNPFSGCDREDAERLELYLTSHAIDYGAESCAPDDVPAARALDRVRELATVFRGAKGFPDACEAVMELCDFRGVAGRLFGDDTDLVEPIAGLIELLKKYGAGEMNADAGAFFSAARAVSVKTLPRTRDRVSVCDPRALRMTRCKKLFVVDFNEGVLPNVTADSGLLSDAELGATGGAIEPTVRQQNKLDREELLAVISNAEEVFCAYSVAGGAKRSAFIDECVKPDGIEETDYVEECGVLKKSDDAALIASFACAVPAAREVAARRMNKHADSISAAVGRGDKTAAPFVPQVELKRGSLSVSELSHWFGCPYKRFLTDSVGLKRRKKGVDAADFGIIMHEFMRKWITIKPLDCSREAVEAIVYPILDERGLYTSERDRFDRERLARDAVDYAVINKRIIDAGDYEPDEAMLEHSFYGELTFGADGVPFTGVIDRVDFSGGRARVIDYKTGNKRFELKKCLDGRDMQLPLYAATLDAEVTGMFYLPLRSVFDADGARLSGCFIKDPDVALGYDRAMNNCERSEILPARLKEGKNGLDFYRPSSAIMERCDFDGLIEVCKKNADMAADEINSGYIERSPAPGECERCPYIGLCTDKKPRGVDEEEDNG